MKETAVLLRRRCRIPMVARRTSRAYLWMRVSLVGAEPCSARAGGCMAAVLEMFARAAGGGCCEAGPASVSGSIRRGRRSVWLRDLRGANGVISPVCAAADSSS